MVPPPANPEANALLAQVLDTRYLDLVTPDLDAITARTQGGRVGQRLGELQAEAQQLAANGQLLKPDNAILRALQADLATTMKSNRTLIDQSGSRMESAGIDAADELSTDLPLAYVAPGDQKKAKQVLSKWKKPGKAAINQVISVTGGDAWQESLQKYTDYPASVINNIVVNGFVNGKSAASVVNQLQQTVGSLPTSAANTLLRTLFLNTYRKATTENYKANADILEYAVRVAALDNRVCLACILLHGTQIPLDEPVADHPNGRCCSVVKIVGIPLNVPTGVDWFLALDAAQQLAIMGPAAFAAWQDGAVELTDFINLHTDDLFGGMVSVASLISILGSAAQQYYGAVIP